MSERPELDELTGATGWHSRIRYAFAAQGASGRRVLDLACGNGFGTSILARTAASVVGADASAGAVKTAAGAFPAANVSYRHVPEPPLPFENGSFDLVVCLETLEHMRREKQAGFVAELTRVLAPDGVLVLSTPDRDAERRYELATGASNPWHLHTPSRGELTNLLSHFPHRLERREAELLIGIAGASDAQPLLEGGLQAPAVPIATMHVCAKSNEALGVFARNPIGFRAEPRLSWMAGALDHRPPRERWLLGDDQAARVTARAPRLRPGSAAWRNRRTLYSLIARLTTGRTLDAGCGPGDGANVLAAAGLDTVATSPATPWLDAARGLHERPGLRFVEAEGLIPDAENTFDAIVCATPEYDPGGAERASILQRALGALAPDGVLFADRTVPGAHSVEIRVRDLVATAIIAGDGSLDLARASLEGSVPASDSGTVFHAISPSPSRLARIREAPPVAVVHADFSREALAMEIFYAARTHDLAGFDPDDRDEMLAIRLNAIEEHYEREIARLNELVLKSLAHRPLFSMRALLHRVRNAIRRA